MTNSPPPPGTSDIMPEEIGVWHFIENAAHKVFRLYGYGEIRTPVLEFTEVFVHGLGSETDVVRKEMYTFKDRGGRDLTLRPEGTAGIIRALCATDIFAGIDKKVYYMGPMFRGERPAAGRKRQFHQIGVENAGRILPEFDAECIFMFMHYLQEIGIEGHSLLMSTRATPEDRKPAEKALKEYYSSHVSGMCEDCKIRFERNIWRILDCKNPQCAPFISETPDMLGYFGDDSRRHFEKVCALLDKMNVKYTVEPRLVRGLDYYVHTVFEVTHPGLGAQNALAGGGRYRIRPSGAKKEVEGIGFAAGMERLVMALQNHASHAQETPFAYIAPLCAEAVLPCMEIAKGLRLGNLSTVAEYEPRSLKSALRAADRLSAKFAIVAGESELEKSLFLCKDMKNGTQKEFPISEIVAQLMSQI